MDNPIKHGNTLLHFLCQYSENPTLLINEHEAVRVVNCCNDIGNTPLHLACSAGNVNAVQFLTNVTECKTNVKNEQQETPALIAFRNRHSVIFRLLVTAHSYGNLFSVLESVNKDLWPEVVKLLTSDETMTVTPQFESQFDVIHFLFNKRVWDLNSLDYHGNTPLHIACLIGDLNVVRIITSYANCNFNVTNYQQETPALIAYKKHHSDIFRLLVTEHHCDCLLSVLEGIEKDLWPEVARILTAGSAVIIPSHFVSQFDVISFLFDKSVWDLNGLDVHGNTPLHFALLLGDLNIVRIITSFTNCRWHHTGKSCHRASLQSFAYHIGKCKQRPLATNCEKHHP